MILSWSHDQRGLHSAGWKILFLFLTSGAEQQPHSKSSQTNLHNKSSQQIFTPSPCIKSSQSPHIKSLHWILKFSPKPTQVLTANPDTNFLQQFLTKSPPIRSTQQILTTVFTGSHCIKSSVKVLMLRYSLTPKWDFSFLQTSTDNTP